MKKLILSVAMALVMVAIAESAEYRDFTNEAGKTIHARIVQYDADDGKVQLQLENRKKAWVELASLSDADQVYINQWKKEKTKTASANVKMAKKPVVELSEKQMKEIGEQYAEAILNKDYSAWASLMESVNGIDEESFTYLCEGKGFNEERWRCRRCNNVKKIKASKIKKNAVILTITDMDYTGDHTSALLVLPSGKIKYDVYFVRHPLAIAVDCAIQLKSENVIHKATLINVLAESGVPLYGLNDLDASNLDQSRSLDKIFAWLKENINEWDSSDPKVFIPKDSLTSTCLGYH